MHYQTAVALNAVEKWVRVLVEECRTRTSLYSVNSKAAAQVSRAGKCLLHAIARLNEEVEKPNQIPTSPGEGRLRNEESLRNEDSLRSEELLRE